MKEIWKLGRGLQSGEKKFVQIMKLRHIPELWGNGSSQLVAMQIPAFGIWNQKEGIHRQKFW